MKDCPLGCGGCGARDPITHLHGMQFQGQRPWQGHEVLG